MQVLLTLLSVPLVLLNILGGIVSCIWLAILGDWWAIGYGILGFLVSRFVIGIVLAPSLALSVPAMALIEKGKIAAAAPFLVLNTIYTYGVISAWCMLVFYIFVRNSTPSSFVPLVIWSYGVAIGPWAHMASQEQQGGSAEGSAIAIFFAQVAYVAVGLTAIFFGSSQQDLTALFAGIMAIAVLIQFALTAMTLSAYGTRGRNAG